MRTVAAVHSYDQGAPRSAGTNSAILQTDRVYWHGQPLAVVVADTLEQARFAAGLVRIDYAEGPAKVLMQDHDEAAFAPKNTLGEPSEVRFGDAEKALAAAEIRVDHVYATARMNHNPIEPHVTTAVWDGA